MSRTAAKMKQLMRTTSAVTAAMALALTVSVAGMALAKENCRRAMARPQQPPVAIDFAADSAELSGVERERIRRLAPGLLQGPDLQLCVIAHTDGQGDDGYNRRLAHRRAEEVIRALSEAGLPGERIVVEVGAAEEASFHPLERRILVLEARR